MLNKEQRNQLL